MSFLKKIGSFFNSRLFKENRNNILLKKLKRQLEQRHINIVVGAGGIVQEGWIETDINTLNLLERRDWDKLFDKKRIDKIVAEHVWEHLSLEDGKLGLRNCYEFLKEGGNIRIAVPDGFHPDPSYINYVRPGGTGAGADDHKVLYNYKLFKSILEELGFKVKLLEYFDENGDFHFTDWSTEDGMIRRSKRFDKRNADGKLNYTSLIIDGVK